MGSLMNDESLARRATRVKQQAAALGFDACGVAGIGHADREDKLGAWLCLGFHADMAWMARRKEIRQDPRLKLPGAQSVIVVARNYYHPRPEADSSVGRVAMYAWGRDYHKVLLKPLRALAACLDAMEPGASSYCCIDSGPVLERAWAARAGLGWVGKNSLVLRRELGSWFFLGVILSTVELEADEPVENLCGSCRACLDACPTQAIVQPGVVDSRLCISYHTIENRGVIPPTLQPAFGDWVFGCDICQEVCPWNRFAQPSSEAAFHPCEGQANPDLAELMAMDETAFNDRFAGTPIRRAKHAGMRRNAEIALANRGKIAQ